jgi:flagellar biosynthesis protein FlhB
MSGDVDPEDKTEEPTEKRLHDAVERGQTAFSREAPLFASLSAALVALIFIIPGRATTLLAGGSSAARTSSLYPARLLPLLPSFFGRWWPF